MESSFTCTMKFDACLMETYIARLRLVEKPSDRAKNYKEEAPAKRRKIAA